MSEPVMWTLMRFLEATKAGRSVGGRIDGIVSASGSSSLMYCVDEISWSNRTHVRQKKCQRLSFPSCFTKVGSVPVQAPPQEHRCVALGLHRSELIRVGDKL